MSVYIRGPKRRREISFAPSPNADAPMDRCAESPLLAEAGRTHRHTLQTSFDLLNGQNTTAPTAVTAAATLPHTLAARLPAATASDAPASVLRAAHSEARRPNDCGRGGRHSDEESTESTTASIARCSCDCPAVTVPSLQIAPLNSV